MSGEVGGSWFTVNIGEALPNRVKNALFKGCQCEPASPWLSELPDCILVWPTLFSLFLCQIGLQKG